MFKSHMEHFHLWDSLAKHLNPELANFYSKYNNQGYATGLNTSAPVTMFRDLTDNVGTVLRYGDYFENTVKGIEEGDESYDFLQTTTALQRKMMFDPKSGFNRSSKIHDKQYQLFGQSVKSITLNRNRNGLLFRTYPLQDVAWTDDYAGDVDIVVRKWKPTYRQASQLFGKDKLHSNFLKACEDKATKFEPCELHHIVMPSKLYGDPSIKEDYVAIWLDQDNGHKIECIGMRYNEYVVSRHFPIAGTPYAYSPIATTALIDARSLQLMTGTLLDAAERYVRPPLIATKKAIKGRLDLTGRTATWIDGKYDERTGDPLRTLDMGSGGYPVGIDQHDRMVNQLGHDLYKEKLTLPERTETASEWNDRMQAYRLGVIPILQPVLDEDTAPTCDLAFDIMMNNNFFGNPEEIPQELQGKDVEFKFSSPLTETEDQKITSTYLSSLEIVAQTMGVFGDQAGANFSVNTGLRDALKANKAKVHWLVSEKETEAKLAEAQAKQQMAEMQQFAASMTQEQVPANA